MYKYNETFFKNPETWDQKQAYFLGWLLSDGDHETSKGIRIRLKESDKRILELLKDIIEYTGPINYIKRNPSALGKLITNSGCKWQNRYGLTITRKSLSEDLIKLNSNNEKSNNLDFPNYLHKSLIPHFLRSYYEGDGTISYCYDKRHPNRLLFEIHLICTPIFGHTLQSILLNELGIKTRIIKNDGSRNGNIMKNGNIYIKFGGNLAALKFFNYVYYDAQTLLKRKFKKFLRLINYMKKRVHKKNVIETNLETTRSINLAKWLISNADY